MKRKQMFCCDATRDLFEKYYMQQQGGGDNFPVYRGTFRQRGHGLGNVLGSLIGRFAPSLKALAPHLLRTGADIFDDMRDGKSFKDAALSRIPETLSNIVFNKKSV